MIRVQGWDLALNHAAMVELVDGELFDFHYIADKASSANRSKNHGTHLPGDRMKREFGNDRHRFMVWRLDFLYEHGIKRWLKESPDFIAIEDYAVRAEQGAHYMGEIGGLARFVCFRASQPFRLHDPTSVKMWGAHDGTCDKFGVEEAVRERWGIDFSRFNATEKDRTTSTDLADAFVLAQMAHAEAALRRGLIQLSDLHEREIRVVNRITKAQPVPLLNREWIERCPSK